MTRLDGLVHAYGLDGKGGGTSLGMEQIDRWKPEQGLLWIHLDSQNDQTREWLQNKSNINPITCASLLEQETRPRTITSTDELLLILRGVNCNPGQDPEDMVAIRMLLTKHRIITMRYRRVMAIQDIHKAVQEGNGPVSSGDFMVMAAERIADRMADVINDLDDDVDALEDSILTAESRELRPKLSDLRRSAISLRRYIAPQRDVLARLVGEKVSWLDERERIRLREVAERSARFVEDIDSLRERAAIFQEELNNRISEQMNKAMYTLSIVAAIFLPLGLLTGLLGINVGGIPGTDNQWAFTLVTIGLSVIAVGLILWFKKIKWL